MKHMQELDLNAQTLINLISVKHSSIIYIEMERMDM